LRKFLSRYNKNIKTEREWIRMLKWITVLMGVAAVAYGVFLSLQAKGILRWRRKGFSPMISDFT